MRFRGNMQRDISFYCVFFTYEYMILRKEVFLEVCPDNKRDKATLLNIIKRRVAPGTKVGVETYIFML